jgi:arabinan endo-1,5-alpha-L-arabinosidase
VKSAIRKSLKGWRDLGLVIASEVDKDNFNAIDPEVIFDESGRLWMFFGSFYSELHIVELDPETGKLKNAANSGMSLIARNTNTRGNPIEAPVVIKRGEYYYLFVSYGLAAQGVRSDYHIVMGRSKAIAGPYVDTAGKPMIEGGTPCCLTLPHRCSRPVIAMSSAMQMDASY